MICCVYDCWKDVSYLEPPRNLILAVTTEYHCVLQRGTFFPTIPSAPSWWTSHSIYIFLAIFLIFFFPIVCASYVWSCDSVGQSCDICELCLVILCVSCDSVGQSCDMYKFCLVIQCDSHMLCARSVCSFVSV